MRIKKITLRRRLRGDFFAVWGRHGGGGEGRGAAPAAPRRGAAGSVPQARCGGGAAGLRPGSRTLQRAAQRKPPRTTAARGELLCRDQSVMGVKTLSLLVSATMSER